MNSKHHDFTEFEDLIVELENPEMHPVAPQLPTTIKNDMRRDLLLKHEVKGLSRHAVGNLWKFAGTAVVVSLLLFLIGGFLAILSNPSTQANSPLGVNSPPTRTPPAEAASEDLTSPSLPVELSSFAALNDLSQQGIAIGNRIQLLSYEVLPTTDGSALRLRWLPLAILDEKFHLFVHVFDQEDNLVFQAEGPMSDEPIVSSDSQSEVEFDISLPTNEIDEGLYHIELGFVNSETGERLLPVSAMNPQFLAENETAVLLTDGLFVQHELNQTAAGDSSSGSGGGGGGNSEATIRFNDALLLTAYEIQQDADGLDLFFEWLPLATLADYTLAAHVVTQDGTIVEQLDIPLQKDNLTSSAWATNVAIQNEHVLPFNNELDGRFELLLSLYDTNSGERLSLTLPNNDMAADSNTAVRLFSWETGAQEDRIWLISASPPFGTNLLALDKEPIDMTVVIGYDLQSADTAQFEFWLNPIVNDEPMPGIVGLTPPVREISRGSGIITNKLEIRRQMNGIDFNNLTSAIIPHVQLVTENNQIQLPKEELDTAIWSLGDLGEVTNLNSDQLWLVSATQHERASATDPLVIEVIVGHNLASEADADLDLWVVSPTWQASDGKAPISISEKVPILRGNGETTFTFNGNPEEIRALTEGSEQLLLQANISHVIDTNNGTQRQSLIRKTFSNYLVNLSRTDEINFAQTNTPLTTSNHESGEIWLISATQKERVSENDPIEIEYTIGYQFASDEEVFIKMSYGDAAWLDFEGNGRLPVDGLDNPIFLNDRQGELTLTASINPQEAKQIVGTDTPVLIAELGYLSESDSVQGNVINFLDHKTFNEFQLNLTETAARTLKASDELSEDMLDILSISPLPGTTISNTTTFKIELGYTLNSLPEAEIMISMFPDNQAITNLSETTKQISQGQGTTTITFDFIPTDTNVASDWHLIIRLLPAEYNNLNDAIQNTLNLVTPHTDPNSDAYQYRP